MYFKVSYDQEFDDLMMYLRGKYPKDLFDLEGIGDQTDMSKFSKKFFSSKVTADASIDANANVDDISVIVYNTELPKPFYKVNSYYVLWKEIKKLYGLGAANRIVESQLTGDIYIHDFHGVGAGLPYCFNYSTYDIMTKGLPMVNKIKSIPPKFLYSFKSQLEQFTVIASNSTLGATGLADILLVMSYYVKNILENGADAHFELINFDLACTLTEEQRTKFLDSKESLERILVSTFSEEQNDIYTNDGFCDDLFDLFTDEQEKIFKDTRKKMTSELISAFSEKQKEMYEKNVYKYVTENIISFIYTINQPMRANQSPFTNVSIFDNNFLEKLKDDYMFPDGSTLDLTIVKKLQHIYLKVMNRELKRTPITFPVTTACFSVDKENNINDIDFLKFISRHNKKFGFINIYTGDSSTLSSCCRLRSEKDSEYFNSFGSGSSKIGSLGVVSINFPRLALMVTNITSNQNITNEEMEETFFDELKKYILVCAQINNAKRNIVKKRIANGNHPLYEYGFMELNKQYSTVGVNGFFECLEILGYNILEKDGQEFACRMMKVINDTNKEMSKLFKAPHNVEQVPGENMSIKMAEKDALLKIQNKWSLYSNQFIPLTTEVDLLERIEIQGLLDKHFSGGAIAHINIDTPINEDQIEKLILLSAKKGVVYFAINYNIRECENGHITAGKDQKCSVCGKEIIANYTRVVGFLVNTKNFHKVRREQDYPNRVFYKEAV